MNTTAIQPSDEFAAMFEAFRAPLRDPSEPFALVVRFEVPEVAEAKVETAFARAKPLTLAERGCLAFELHREAQQAGRFVVYDRWRTFGDFEAHHHTSYIARLRDDINALLTTAPEFHVLESTSA